MFHVKHYPMELLKECPICKSENYDEFLECADYLVTQQNFQLVKCSQCEFVFTNPRPPESLIQDYYSSEDYYSHQKKSVSLISSVYNMIRNINVNNKLDLISKYHSASLSLLDYGCGAGVFLEAARKRSYSVAGVEPNTEARQIVTDLGMEVYTPDELDQLKNQSYDVISLWHVLEHIHCLNESFELLKAKLKSDGIMLIALPNLNSWDAQKYKANWAAYDVPRHLYHFSKNTLSKFAEKHGMKIVGIHPMKFDAFYVSLLSEANSVLKYPNAIANGIRSNFNARKSVNHSSLIYILKKL